MRAEVVKGERSALNGRKCAACPQVFHTGQVVLTHRLSARGFHDPLFAVHADCAQSVLDRAPEGAPVQRPDARAAAIRRSVRRSGSLYPDLV